MKAKGRGWELSFPIIKTEIPGPKARRIIEEGKKLLATTTRDFPIVVARAENDVIWDVDGNAYIDFAAGIAVANVGHNNPEVIGAIEEQLKLFVHSAPHDFFDTIQVRAARRLLSILPKGGERKVYFGNSGTESVEAAIKIARYNTGRPVYISFIRAFHGRTMGSLSLTASKPVHRRAYFPLLPQTYHFHYAYCYRCPLRTSPEVCNADCLDFLEEAFDTYLPPEVVAAIIFEPIQGEGGYIVPPAKFVRRLEKLARERGILLIADEVQTGFARTGKLFAVEHFGVDPDIICLGKAIANGLPLGATAFKKGLDFEESGAHSSTFGGNALALAAMVAVIDYILKHNLAERADRLGRRALAFLRDLLGESRIVGDVRGLGLMIGVEIVRDRESKTYAPELRDRIVKEAMKRGLILLPAGKSAFRIAPPLTIEERHLDVGLEIIREVVKSVEG